MSARRGQQEHATLQTAEAALEEIAARGQSADPRSFALWYNFAAGESGLLTEAVNKKLARAGALTPQEIDELYAAHISPAGAPDKVDKLGAQVADEIEQVVAMIEAAEGSASSYSANLADVSKRLDKTDDRAGIRAIVEGLVLATKEMEASNARLQLQLQAMLEEIARLRREIEIIRTESLTDALTSLGNRKYFNAALEKSVADSHAANETLSLLLADVDHFKKINDTYGHVVGDRVLRFVATITKGELVRRSTGEKHATLTISIGVAALHPGASAQSLLEAADVCLYAAKGSGRNCVVGEADERLFEAVTR